MQSRSKRSRRDPVNRRPASGWRTTEDLRVAAVVAIDNAGCVRELQRSTGYVAPARDNRGYEVSPPGPRATSRARRSPRVSS